MIMQRLAHDVTPLAHTSNHNKKPLKVYCCSEDIAKQRSTGDYTVGYDMYVCCVDPFRAIY
jgi:hypothetical protein